METQTITKTVRHLNSPQPQPAVPAAPPPARPVTEAVKAEGESRPRRYFFRIVRLACAGALVWTTTALVQKNLSVVSSDQAYLNGAVTALHAPISGLLQLQPLEPGMEVKAGATLFRVENPRFGNAETMSQLNWIQELVDRLRTEATEADLRFARQSELFKHHEALFKDKLISRVEYLEEETKAALSRVAMDSKHEQLRSAEARCAAMQKQLELQKEAVTTMPFDGVVWSARIQAGGEVGAHETILQVVDRDRVWVDAFVKERYAAKFQVGTQVTVRAVDGPESWTGRVEAIRGGVGRFDPEQSLAVPAGDLSHRRIAVRVRLESANPFSTGEFFGIGRSVKVTVL